MVFNRLLENKNATNYEVYNLGTGKGSSVLEAITAFEQVTRKSIYKCVELLAEAS